MATKKTLELQGRKNHPHGYHNEYYKQRAMKRLARFLKRYPTDLKVEEMVKDVPFHIMTNANIARG